MDPINQIWARAHEDDGGGSGSRCRARMGEARARPLVEMARDGRGAWRWWEAMGSGGGVVALGRRMKTMDREKKTRRYIFVRYTILCLPLQQFQCGTELFLPRITSWV